MTRTVTLPRELRVLSIVEARAVTGPLRPLLALSSPTRYGFGPYASISRLLMTTSRASLTTGPQNELYNAVKESGIEYHPIRERRLFDPGVLRQMYRCIRAFGPHIVETHDYKSHFLFFVLSCLHPA